MGYECASLFSTLTNIYSTFEAGNDPIPKGAKLASTTEKNGVKTVTADVIQVQWQAKDQKIISLLSARSSASKTSGKAPKSGARQTAPTAASTMAPTSDQSSGGLSTGAKIGLGVAIPLVVLALIGIGSFFFLRRRKTRGRRHDELPAEVEAKPAMPPQYIPNTQQQHYDRPKQRPLQEMDAHTYNNELPAEPPTPEIGGREMQRGSTYKDHTNRNGHY